MLDYCLLDPDTVLRNLPLSQVNLSLYVSYGILKMFHQHNSKFGVRISNSPSSLGPS